MNLQKQTNMTTTKNLSDMSIDSLLSYQHLAFCFVFLGSSPPFPKKKKQFLHKLKKKPAYLQLIAQDKRLCISYSYSKG